MSKTEVDLDIQDEVARITFFTDGGLNILSPDTLHSFGAAIASVKRNPAARVAIIGAKGKAFLAGADIKMMREFTVEDARAYGDLGQSVFTDLSALPLITIAAVNGAAMGGGLELAVACDFRVAVKHARLGLPEITLGLIPGWGGIPRLTKLVGYSRARRMILSGLPVSAEEGHGFNLVDEIVNSVEDLAPRVAAFCKSFRRASPAAVALAKRASRDLDDVGAFADCFQCTESREGMTAFIEKRPASWMSKD